MFIHVILLQVLNDSRPSNSSLQHCNGYPQTLCVCLYLYILYVDYYLKHVLFVGNDDLADEDVDIGGNESPVSNYPPVEIEKDTTPRIRKCPSPGSSTGVWIFL